MVSQLRRKTSTVHPSLVRQQFHGFDHLFPPAAQYLATLERFLEPLASGDLDQILDILPALMNAVKMVHTIAR